MTGSFMIGAKKSGRFSLILNTLHGHRSSGRKSAFGAAKEAPISTAQK
jgi:hypothetical protein